MTDELIDCPGGCGLRLPADDSGAQMEHMRSHHPEIVEERLRTAGMHSEADEFRAGRDRPPQFRLFVEALRLVEVAADHRDRMLRERELPELALQRANAAAFARTEGMVAGIAKALRELGYTDAADQIEHALDAFDPHTVPQRA